MIAYEDFELQFYAGRNGVPHVRASGVEGEARAPLQLPDVLVTDGGILERLARHAGASGGHADEPDEIGRQLHDALFGDEIGVVYAKCRAALPDGFLLRIRLQFDLADPDLQPIAALPWELMRDRATDGALVLDADLALVRHLDLALTTRLPPFVRPLRILFAMSNPLGDLALDAERAKIESRLREHAGEIVADFVDVHSLAELESRLSEGRYHVLHFMGHGDFEEGTGGLLIGERLYDAAHLAPSIGAARDTRLVVLNACRTAEITRVRGMDPFAGVATALVQKGVPAVVAMQLPILDDAAALFAERFYTELARRQPLEEAVGRARLSLWSEYASAAICATPVLFVRARVDPFAAEPQAAAADVPSLATFMLDRLEVVKRIAGALQQHASTDGMPLIAIAHGADEACFDTLVDRLQRIELPRYLDIDDRRQSIRRYRFECPPEYASAEELHAFLTFSIARAVAERGQATASLLHSHLGSLPAPPLVYGTLSAATWQAYGGRRGLDDFLGYWRDWPRAPGRQRVLALLNITYAEAAPERRGLLRWLGGRQPSANDEITAAMKTLATANGGPPIVVLELGEISYDHAKSWASDVGRPDLIPAIRALFRDHERDTGRVSMSMEQASRLLEDMLAGNAPISEGAA